MCFLKSNVAKFGLVLFLLTSGLTVVAAQEQTGTVTGEVTDMAGAVIPNATVRISNRSIIHEIQTSESGRFAFMVPPGTYVITVEAHAFKTAKLKNVRVKPGGSNTLKVPLKVRWTTSGGRCPKGQICL